MRAKFSSSQLFRGQISLLLLFGLLLLSQNLFPGKGETGSQNDHFNEIIWETIQSGDQVILLEESGSLSKTLSDLGATIIPWNEDLQNHQQTARLADLYCPPGTGTEQRLFLTWDTPDPDAIYSLGPKTRGLYMTFSFRRVSGTNGRLYQLTPLNALLTQYCAVRAVSKTSPILIVIQDGSHPMTSSVRLDNITWASIKELKQNPAALLESVTENQTVLLIEPGILDSPDLAVLQSYITQKQPIGNGVLIQISP